MSRTTASGRLLQALSRALARECFLPTRRLQLAAIVICTSATFDSSGQSPLPDSLNPGLGNGVSALAVQGDGRILVGGDFFAPQQPAGSYLVRLNADGSRDPGFAAVPNSSVYAIAIQANGGILLGGSFSSVNGQGRTRLARLHPDGTVDGAFNPGVGGQVLSLCVQPDGRILVGGSFTTLAGQGRNFIGRLHADGSLDAGFTPNVTGEVNAIAVQPDGAVLLGGFFGYADGQSRPGLARFSADGVLDAGFNAGIAGSTKAVFAVLPQSDGKILVGGQFTGVGGQPRTNLARVEASGALDTGFQPGVIGGAIVSLALQSDGRVLAAGDITHAGGQLRSNLVRFLPDGTVDGSFTAGANRPTGAIALQPDGRLLVGGNFSILAGQPRSGLGRLQPTGAAGQSLAYDGTFLSWMRSGTTPEVAWTQVEQTLDGVIWTSLGAGSRVPGGWTRFASGVPSNATVRFRGQVTGGARNCSAWLVDGLLGTPLILLPPASRTNAAGSTATFSVGAGGTEPFSYRWHKAGVPLAEDGRVLGVTSPTLTVSNVLEADESPYSVVISNAHGSVTSVVSILTVLDPWVHDPPSSRIREPGQSVTFEVGLTGTAPFHFQWRKDDADLPQATSPTLTLTDLQPGNAGLYSVVVTNLHGSITSAPARLTVNQATLDTGFQPAPDGYVAAFAVQPDGNVLLGGAFTTINGQSHGGVARWLVTGLPDANFVAQAGGSVETFAIQPDGRILVGGNFTNLNGQARLRLARLETNGMVDAGFNASADAVVHSLVLQPDGKVLIAGAFTSVNAQPRARLARLNPDGSLDASFNPGAGGTVYTLALQRDGHILVGGAFVNLGGQARQRLARLLPDGTVDPLFTTGTDTGSGNFVRTIAVQPDGRLLVGGLFFRLGGVLRNHLARLEPDGRVDMAFNAGVDWVVFSLALQADGGILIGGYFSQVAGQPRSYLARLRADGALEGSFNPGASDPVLALALQPDGRVLTGGMFTNLSGQPVSFMARLHNTLPAVHQLQYDGETVVWRRSGSSPEIWRVTLEASTNGTDWISLGEAAPIAGGWRRGGVNVSETAILRARGYVAASARNASSWFAEAIAGPPWPLRLRAARDGSSVLLRWFGGNGPFQIQHSPNPADPGSWQDDGGTLDTNSVLLPLGPGARFLRVRGQ